MCLKPLPTEFHLGDDAGVLTGETTLVKGARATLRTKPARVNFAASNPVIRYDQPDEADSSTSLADADADPRPNVTDSFPNLEYPEYMRPLRRSYPDFRPAYSPINPQRRYIEELFDSPTTSQNQPQQATRTQSNEQSETPQINRPRSITLQESPQADSFRPLEYHEYMTPLRRTYPDSRPTYSPVNPQRRYLEELYDSPTTPESQPQQARRTQSNEQSDTPQINRQLSITESEGSTEIGLNQNSVVSEPDQSQWSQEQELARTEGSRTSLTRNSNTSSSHMETHPTRLRPLSVFSMNFLRISSLSSASRPTDPLNSQDDRRSSLTISNSLVERTRNTWGRSMRRLTRRHR